MKVGLLFQLIHPKYCVWVILHCIYSSSSSSSKCNHNNTVHSIHRFPFARRRKRFGPLYRELGNCINRGEMIRNPLSSQQPAAPAPPGPPPAASAPSIGPSTSSGGRLRRRNKPAGQAQAQSFENLKHEQLQKTASRVNESRLENISSSASSIISLSDWIQKFGITADQLLGRKRETFLDHNGILRYVDNWQLVEEDVLNTELARNDNFFYDLTGCIKVNVLHLKPSDESSKKQPGAQGSSKAERISVLNDWKLLWNFFSWDNEDEIAEQAPLLRLFIEFFFHFRTCQIMVGLYLYNITIMTICLIAYPHANVNSYLIYDYFTATVQMFTYFAIIFLYRGKISLTENASSLKANPHIEAYQHRMKEKRASARPDGAIPPPAAPPVPPSDSTAPAPGPTAKYVTYYSVHWSSTIRQLVSKSKEEISRLLFRSHQSHPPPHHTHQQQEHPRFFHPDDRTPSYYELLNISLKFLIRHNGIQPKEIDFDRPTYRLVLLFAVTVFPVYLFFSDYFTTYLLYVIPICLDQGDSEFCRYYMLYIILSLGSLTKFALQFVFGGSVLVALVGLAYGGEIAFRLINSWMTKFSCLRRVSYHHSSLIVQSPQESEHSSSASERQESSSHADGFIQAKLDSRASAIELKEIEGSDQSDAADSENDLFFDYGVSVDSFNDLLRRDATEHYFFIKHVLAQAGKIWSPALTGMMVLDIYIVASYLSFLLIFGKALSRLVLIQLGIYMAVRTIILVIYPIASICHANSVLYEIQECFQNSSPEDFSVIGGRDRWMKFIELCPIVWTYFGIWVTWGKLGGLIWTGIVGLIAYFITSTLQTL